MTRVISIIVAVLAIALGGYYFLTQSRDDTPTPTPAAEQPATDTPAADDAPAAEEEATADEPVADDPAAGEETAPEDDTAAADTPADNGTPADDTADAPEGQDVATADTPAATEDAPADDAAVAAEDTPDADAVDTDPVFDADALAADIVQGDADAPITVIEYGSFTCPHCADFYENVHGKLKANYIDTGKVRFIHREVYFDRFGLWAGMVARCGGPQRYYGIVEMIYDTQREWIGSGENAEVIDNLKKLGRTAGLGNDQIDDCLKSEPLAEALVAAYQTNAEADEVTGTPSFVINGEKHPNMSYASFTEILDGLLAE